MSRVPIVRPVSWSAILVIVSLFVFVGIAGAYWRPRGGASTAIYFTLACLVGSRLWFTRAHRKGMRYVRKSRFKDGIEAFQESFDYFTRQPRLDRWRTLLLLSGTTIGYREMALCNMAFCYSQIGDGERARSIYLKVLEDYPDNFLAVAALRMMDSATVNSASSD